MSKEKDIARKILDFVGGKENIISSNYCMTRLRIDLKNKEKADTDAIKGIDGVLGIVDHGDLQIVLGPGLVQRVATEFSNLTQLKVDEVDEDLSYQDVTTKNKVAQKKKHEGKVQVFLKHIANIFVPLLPGIIAAGLINGITNVINVSTNNVFSNIWWYETIRTMGWGLFTLLPVLVGMNAAKEFGGSGVLGAIAGTMSVSIPSMPLLAMGNTVPLVTMPFTGQAFNPSAGGLLAALFMGIFFAILEKNIRKVMPNLLDTFLTPLITVIVGSILSILVIQPFGAFVTQGIFSVLNFVWEKLGIVGGYLLSAGFLPLVAVGLHQALTPIHALLNDPSGPTKGINYLLPILMMAGGGQVGAGLAIYLKTKNQKLKRLTRDSLPVGILGIGEPLMYAVTLPLGKPFVTACLGSGLGGIFASLFHLGAVSQGVSGLFGALIMVPGTQIKYFIAMILAYVGGFVLTYLFGVDENRINAVYGGKS